jgi:hypothetical protein
MHLERIGTSINMANHFMKVLNWALFHRYTNFLLGHVPPMYSPIYQENVGTYTDQSVAIEPFVPDSFTPPPRCGASLGGTLDYIPNPTLRLKKQRVFTFGFWSANNLLKVSQTIRNVWRDPKTSAFLRSTNVGIVCDPSIEFIINRL